MSIMINLMFVKDGFIWNYLFHQSTYFVAKLDNTNRECINIIKIVTC